LIPKIKHNRQIFKKIISFVSEMKTMIDNPLIFSLIPALVLGILNGWYWRKQGYKGWHLFYLGTMAFYALSVMILKKI
jgi:hypothetical protein